MDTNRLNVLRLDEKRAELAYHQARVRRLEAELAETAAAEGFDPAWKKGPHLSAAGRRAIIDAYQRGMRPAAVSRLFLISEKASLEWYEKAQKDHAARRTLDPDIPPMPF